MTVDLFLCVVVAPFLICGWQQISCKWWVANYGPDCTLNHKLHPPKRRGCAGAPCIEDPSLRLMFLHNGGYSMVLQLPISSATL